MIRKISLFALTLTLLAPAAGAQDPVASDTAWTLDRCIRYAVENNVTVQQRKLSSENRAIQLNTARNSRLPGVDANIGGSFDFGRVLNGEDNTYENTSQFTNSWGASASVVVFNGMRIKHEIAVRSFDLQAALHDLEKAREDVSLNVTALYMQALFNKELLKVAESQVELSRKQVERSEALVQSGKSPESELFESRALLAKDELNLTQSRNNLTLSLLDLSQAINRESAEGFDIRVPDLDGTVIDGTERQKTPGSIYDYAVENRPGIMAEKARLESSKKSLLAAKAARYPQISLSGGYSTRYYHSFRNSKKEVDVPSVPALPGDTLPPIPMDYFHLLKNNSSEYIGLSASIPIFNRFATRNNIRSARIGILTQELALVEAERNLRKEIEQAYYSADAAYEKYVSATKSLEAAREAFRYQEEKTAAGKSTIFDFNDAKTRMEKSESELVQAKFEFLFRSKILDFYAGRPLDFTRY
ncbi:TolC family protein [uncultured Alistipes sp.]|uniref:TolC family protein n=1 Tax=uncultured Alistipes sp. TaxID=538949 RepID=UPI002636EB13|nr:TolC family protein [uncultured Alistipes sp.]